jgi:hypothetical protein
VNSTGPLEVNTLGLFEERIPGDDCLMKLAKQRFAEAHMGAEMHAASPQHLESVMTFRPWADSPVVLHLPRNLHLNDEQSRKSIYEFASLFAGRISGMVVHDHKQMATGDSAFMNAAREMNMRLRQLDQSPLLFIEYAVGMEPADFVCFFKRISDLDYFGPCIDIGHVGIRAARVTYARGHGGEDVCALKSQPPELRERITDVEEAVASGFAAVSELIKDIAAVERPVHFHLHDAHPLSTFSPFGVSDHLSFLTDIPLNFEYRGRRNLSPMFGSQGLAKLVTEVLKFSTNRRISFTLEIHPTEQRLPLGDSAALFSHWTDKTNAEKMNHWLSVLTSNHMLLREAVRTALLNAPSKVAAD